MNNDLNININNLSPYLCFILQTSMCIEIINSELNPNEKKRTSFAPLS